MKTIKSYLTSHREETEGAMTLLVLTVAGGVALRVIGLNDAYHYAFGMASGTLAMWLVTVLCYARKVRLLKLNEKLQAVLPKLP